MKMLLVIGLAALSFGQHTGSVLIALPPAAAQLSNEQKQTMRRIVAEAQAADAAVKVAEAEAKVAKAAQQQTLQRLTPEHKALMESICAMVGVKPEELATCKIEEDLSAVSKVEPKK